MIKDIAQLFFAVTGLATVIPIAAVFCRPPEFLKRLRRFKAWQLQAEVAITRCGCVGEPSSSILGGLDDVRGGAPRNPQPPCHDGTGRHVRAGRSDAVGRATRSTNGIRYSMAEHTLNDFSKWFVAVRNPMA